MKSYIISLFFLVISSVYCLAEPVNLEIDLPDTYHTVRPGQDVWFTINLLNLANTDRMDVTLNYAVSDEFGNVLVTRSKTVAIETQASFVADIKIPKNAKIGNYFLSVSMNSTLGESSSKISLRVSPQKSDMQIYFITAAIILIAIIIFAIIKSRPFIEKVRLRMRIKGIIHKKLSASNGSSETNDEPTANEKPIADSVNK